MPEIKNTFTRGKMNKDLDERIVPNGQYRDAMNIQVSTSDESDVGTVQNILGNTSIENVITTLGFACVGSVADEKTNKLYWFVKSNNVDAIVEYSDDEVITPVLVDTKVNTADAVLRFKENIITGINIIDDLLLWTDNENEPRKINIERCKQGNSNSASLVSAAHTKLVINNQIVTEKIYLTAIAATGSASMIVSDASDLEVGGALISIDLYSTNNIITAINGNTITLTTDATWGDTDLLVFSIPLNVKEEHITVIKKKPTKAPTFEITTTEDSTENLLFEKIFPRFSCRYKYEDGEYSAFGPFTDVVFKSNYLDEFDKDDSFTIKDVYNTGAVNIIKSINLSDFIAPDMPRDVVQVDILYKQENSNVVFSIDSIKRTDEAWDLPGSNQQSPYIISKYRGSYDVLTENIYAAVPANQLLRPWDNVPKKALAQEVTGNRIVYGNYIQGYDFGNNEIDGAPIRPDVNADYGFRFLSPNFVEGGLPSIKSLRNYQLGIIYGDKYGRETPVFTSSNGAIRLGWFDKDSNLSASQSYQLKASTASYFPEWADYYKIFIKETSGEYYNLVMDRVYPPVRASQVENHLWMSFYSTDRSKISEDDYIILKKNIRDGAAQIGQDNKFKVIDIKNEAPDAVKYGEHLDIGSVENDASTSSGILNASIFNTYQNRPTTGRQLLKVHKQNWLNEGGTKLDNEEFREEVLYFSFYKTDTNEYSKKYRVSSVQLESTQYRVRLKEEIVETFQVVVGTNLLKNKVVVKFERAALRSDQHLSGRFFVKIKSNAFTRANIENSPNSGNTIQYFQDVLTNLYWFADVRSLSTTYYNDAQGIVNGQQPGSIPTGGDNAPLAIFGNNVTKTKADWEILTNGTHSESRPMFIDSMYMASNQLNSGFDVKHEGHLVYGPKYEIPNGEDDDSGHESRRLPLKPGDVEAGDRMINGLEGFVTTTTDGPHISGQGIRRWKTDFNTHNLDNTYGTTEGKHFLHLSFAVCGKDLHNGDTYNEGTLIPYRTKSLGPSPSFGNTPQLQLITNTKAIKLTDDPDFSVYSEKDIRIVNEYPYGHATLLPQYAEDYNNQWNPAYGGTGPENTARQNIINAIHEKKKFRFKNKPNEIYSIKSYKTKRIYNHTPWQLTYEISDGINFTQPLGTIVEKEDSVEWAIREWRAKTGDVAANNPLGVSATAEELAVWSKIVDFGKANNRRLCYIIELDIDITGQTYQPLTWTDVPTGILTIPAQPDADTPVLLEFIDVSYDIPGGGQIKNPSIWETESKENVDLDIYYEASQAIPINITENNRELFAPIGSRVEFLDNPAAIDGGFSVVNDLYLANWSTGASGDQVLSLSEEINEKDGLGSSIAYNNKRIRFHRKDGSYTTGRIKSATLVTSTQADSLDSIIINTSIDPGSEIGLSWYNCLSFGNGLETDRIRDDFNAMTIGNGVKASTTIEEQYGEEHRKNGMIYSGLYNSTSGVNNLNQFIMAEKITKDLNPTFGSIQKLFTRRISLIAFCEDRVVGITANKNALYNADGNPQLVATNMVLGDANPFVGDFGISTDPESFAKESYRAYFTDKQRGAVLRLSMDGLTPISDAGMHDYFRDNLKTASRLIGTYDAHKKNYNLTLSDFLPENLIVNNLSTGGQDEVETYIDPTNFVVDGDLGYGLNRNFPPLPLNDAWNPGLKNRTTIINHPTIVAGNFYGGASQIEEGSTTAEVDYVPPENPSYVVSTSTRANPIFNMTADPFNGGTPAGSPAPGWTWGRVEYTPSSTTYPYWSANNEITLRRNGGKAWPEITGVDMYHGEEFYVEYTVNPGAADIDPKIELYEGNSPLNISKLTSSGIGGGGVTPATPYVTDYNLEFTKDFNDSAASNSFQLGNLGSSVTMKCRVYFKIEGQSGTHYTTYTHMIPQAPGGVSQPGYTGTTETWTQITSTPVISNFTARISSTSGSGSFNYKLLDGGMKIQRVYRVDDNGSVHTPYGAPVPLTTTLAIDPIPLNPVASWAEVIHNTTLPYWILQNSYLDSSSNARIATYGSNTGSGNTASGTAPNGTTYSWITGNPNGVTTYNQYPGSPYISPYINETFTVTTNGTNTALLTQNLDATTGTDKELVDGNWYEVKLTGVSGNSGIITVHKVLANQIPGTVGGPGVGELGGHLGTVHGDGESIQFYDEGGGIWKARWQQDASASGDNTKLKLLFHSFTGTIEKIEFADITDKEQGGQLTYWILNNPDPIYNYYSDPSIFYYDNGQVIWDGTGVADMSSYTLTQSFNQSTSSTPQEQAEDIDSSPFVTNDGYEFKFKVSNYSGLGKLSGFVMGAKGAVTSHAEGIGFDGINENGYWLITCNMDGTTQPTIANYTDADYVQLGSLGSATVALKNVQGTTWDEMNRVTFAPTSGADFKVELDNISLRDLTNYFTIPSSGAWNFTGFDLSLLQYITWDNVNESIVFTDAPEVGADGDIISLTQGIPENSLIQGDTVKLKFDITNYSGSGEISGYFFNQSGEGFTFGPISNVSIPTQHIIGDSTTSILAGILGVSENEIARDTFVVYVSTGDFSGTLNNFELYRIFPNFSPTTITYSEDVKGWISFKSFFPESGLSLSKDYYTMKDGGLWKHHSNETRNEFYGEEDIKESTITAILNTEPSLVKIFNTLNYEGSQSKVNAYATDDTTSLSNIEIYNLTDKAGWYVDSIITDKQKGDLNEFIEKEGKWFNYIKGDVNDIQTSDLSFQGLGVVSGIVGGSV